MRRITAVAAVVAVLVLGFVVGVLATHLFYASRIGRPGGLPQFAGHFFAERLEYRLDLTPAQRTEIGRILEETRREAETLRREVHPQVVAVMERAATRISEILTPEQRIEFERLREEHRHRAEHFLLGPPGPSGRHHRGGPTPRRPPP